ncbi:unnamed protein product [Mesocestoides corti]|uniref:Ephrin RBD domain-containing protein n=2 Tax=Mesocestoides corti TaxID=53468 RepID=A0A0R3UMM4_MESCO|nr:unnamed protein product [Mesocestoides corti]
MQPTALVKTSTVGGVGASGEPGSPPTLGPWHLITSRPTSSTLSLRRPMPNNAMVALPNLQKGGRSFASKVSGMLFTQKSYKSPTQCGSRQLSPQTPSVILLPTSTTNTATTAANEVKNKGYSEQLEFEPHSTYTDGSNTYYVINIDQRTGTSPRTCPYGGSPQKPSGGALACGATGPDSSYV